MISALSGSWPAGSVLVATGPVDFRRGADGLARTVQSILQQDPFSGTVFVFRSKRAERTGPQGTRVHGGFHDGHGSRFWDADSGDDCEDPAGLFRPGEADQGDLPRVSGVAEGRAQGGSADILSLIARLRALPTPA